MGTTCQQSIFLYPSSGYIRHNVRVDFADWLSEQMKANALTPASLARHSGMSEGAISHIFSGRRKPGFEFCVSIAPALRQKPEAVLRAAELLPPLAENDQVLEQFSHKLGLLPPEGQKHVLEFLDFLLSKEKLNIPTKMRR